MPGLTLHTDTFVLLKRPPGDSFQSCTVFSAEHGNLHVMQRLPKKKSGGNIPLPLDLFDEAALILESSNQGHTWFVKESRLISRAVGIGRSYEALLYASAFSSLIARNHVSEESRAPVAALLKQAFMAFNSSERPDIAHFKAVYCFARDEGYPIKQHWLPTLPVADRRVVTELLNQPIAIQSATVTIVTRLQNRLEEYLRGHTEILFD